MGELLIRRRELILTNGGTPIVCPYITDGLIFWLDGINRGGITGKWTDLIGGKTFTLNNVTELENGVTFSSSGYGTYSGAVSANWQTETIEMAIAPMSIRNKCFLSPANASVFGIGLITATSVDQFSINTDGSSNKKWNCVSSTARLSANKSYAVVNGVSRNQNTNDSWSKNTSGTTYLGCRYTSSRSRYMNGTLYSLRIYNRQLSVSEMQSNQAIDVARFYS